MPLKAPHLTIRRMRHLILAAALGLATLFSALARGPLPSPYIIQVLSSSNYRITYGSRPLIAPIEGDLTAITTYLQSQSDKFGRADPIFILHLGRDTAAAQQAILAARRTNDYVHSIVMDEQSYQPAKTGENTPAVLAEWGEYTRHLEVHPDHIRYPQFGGCPLPTPSATPNRSRTTSP